MSATPPRDYTTPGEGDEADDNASIVLVGRRGSGLSSFAVIASRVLDYRIVDVEERLKREHGMSRSACIKAWGVRRFRDIATAELEAALQQHHQRHVLLCGPEVTEPRGRTLLQSFGRRHPVIMIDRDVDAVLQYLRLDAVPDARAILQQTQDIFRSLSNLEFFNIPENEAPDSLSARMNRGPAHSDSVVHREKGLQNVTHDFTQFLALLRQRPRRLDQMLSPLELERREFSTVLSLPVGYVVKESARLIATDCACDAIELTVDLKAKKNDVARSVQVLRRLSSLPIIYHVQWQSDASPADEEKYMDLFHFGLRHLPEYVTLDLHCTSAHMGQLANAAQRSRTVAHRRFAVSEPCPWRLNDFPYVHQAAALGCVAARFVRDARSPLEDRDCVQFHAAINTLSSIPVSATNVGLYARSAMVTNRTMTPVIQPTLSLIDSKELSLAHDALMKARFSNLAYQALHFHILGSSVDYSLSPSMHNSAFEFLGMSHTYQAHQTDRIGDLQSLVDDTCGGISVTLPFKTEVIGLVDSMSDAARVIHAVNTVIPRRHGANDDGSDALSKCHRNKAGPILGLHGENTDWIALRTCIARHLSTANSITPSTTALIIGAGGMAKAAIYALLQLDLERIYVWNRTSSKAKEVSDHFNTVMPPSGPINEPRVRILHSLNTAWPEGVSQPSIVVCTPPVHEINGVPGLAFEVPEPWFQSPTGGVIIELSYKTSWTRLMQQAHDNAHRGWTCVDPLEILIEQGCAQFELFTGHPAPKKRMTDSLTQQFNAILVASHGQD